MGLSVDQRVGRKIRHLRWKSGITRGDLAQATGVSETQLERFEMGAERVPAQTLWRIAGQFRVEVKVFYPLEGDADPDLVEAISALADFLTSREASRLIFAYDQLSQDERQRIFNAARRGRWED